jgi:N-methylhydantoinase A/oxoprolinase/acetone carboxylase beta subunit/N-methylhydantoinase B/oxoprolinase/acetone carboxylase alpha subunit
MSAEKSADQMGYRIGIDTGGTFTDIVLLDEETGEVITRKVASTPEEPGLAVLEGLHALGKPPGSIVSLVLGTTTTTNAAVQRKGAAVFYLTTAGFEDVPHLQRADKPDPYDLQWVKPRALVSRRNCLGVAERIGPEGQVLKALTEQELVRMGDRVAAWLAETNSPSSSTTGFDDHAVAVNLLFSYANGAHERAIAAYLGRRFPGLSVSLSSEVSPLWREYERASTTILDAFTRPMLRRFLIGLEQRLKAEGYAAPLSVMKSNGGQMLAAAAVDRPIHLLLSGLAGGVIAGRAAGAAHGCHNVITFDMGGTSTDVAVIVEGELTNTTEYQLEFGQPVSIPSLDVITIGAGGGSIAWVDKGGLLKVGPHSAGAAPGPACYALGGSSATVTDANLVLGRLGPDSLLDGAMTLDPAAAFRALQPLAQRLDTSVDEAALAIIAITNENMANSIRVLTVERGIDPRNFALVAFGGAGPMHGAEVAQILGIRHVIVPPDPGVASALGALLTTPRVDAQRTYVRRGENVSVEELNAVLADLQRGARADLAAEGHAETPDIRTTVSMRYLGQSHELDVPVIDGRLADDALATLVERYHLRHEASYGYRIAGERIEITGCSVAASCRGGSPEVRREHPTTTQAVLNHREVRDGLSRSEWPVHSRDALRPDSTLVGPAIVEGYDAAVLLPKGIEGRVAADGTVILTGPATSAEAPNPTEAVTLSIINNAFVNICREMGTAMVRTAYSPIFNESRDFSCALFDRRGQLLAQGEYCPAQLGAIVYTVECLLRELGGRVLAPGDVVIHNDPYRGGCHMPEHLLVKPIYHEGELVAYAAIIAHLAEIGGMVVGSFAATATEVFQEGLRLPPVLLMRRGERVQEVWDIMMANHRTPRHTWGDLHAMLGALSVAEQRFHALCAKYGAPFLTAASAALLDYAERWMRAEIAAIPDGIYEFADYLEDDGVEASPVRMRVKVTVAGERFVADYTASDRQARGPVNATRGVTISATYNALYQLADKAIPRNAGCYRAVEVLTRPGSCLDVAFPAPSVGGNTETQPRIVFLVLGALARAVPDRVSASEGCTACNFLIGGENSKTGEYFAHYHFEASGWGGRAAADGNDVQNHIIGNCRITPIEVFETRFPITVLSYGLLPDSGGAGRFRGGLGSRRVMRIDAPEMRASMLMDYTQHGPWPLFGGQPGRPAKASVRKAGSDRFVPFSEAFGTKSASKFADVRLIQGDEVCIESCGGAGYGDPRQRDVELIALDVADGFVSKEAAAALYGCTTIGWSATRTRTLV